MMIGSVNSLFHNKLNASYSVSFLVPKDDINAIQIFAQCVHMNYLGLPTFFFNC